MQTIWLDFRGSMKYGMSINTFFNFFFKEIKIHLTYVH